MHHEPSNEDEDKPKRSRVKVLRLLFEVMVNIQEHKAKDSIQFKKANI